MPDDDWWTALLASAEWAWTRRFAVRGQRPDPSVPLAAADFAAGALADSALADALEAEHVDLDRLEDALVYAPGRALDTETFARAIGHLAFARNHPAVTIDDAWTYLLLHQEVADAAWMSGIERVGDAWRATTWGRVRGGVARAMGAAWPVVGHTQREAIVIEDHDVVTRDFVFHLLVDEALLTPIAALRALRRIERDGEARVFVGTSARVESRWQRVHAALVASSSPLRVRRAPRS